MVERFLIDKPPCAIESTKETELLPAHADVSLAEINM